MEDIREYWLVVVGKEAMYVSEKIVRVWGGNSIPRRGEILPFSVKKGKKRSKVDMINVKNKKIWLKGM